MFSRILSQSTARSARLASVRFASTASHTAKSGHVGEMWAVTEIKRIVPTFFVWTSVMAGVLSWPYVIHKVLAPTH